MSAVWFTSDLHLRHNKVAELRGFTHPGDGTRLWPDSLGHDEEIVKRWNDRVHPGDHVWVLGDVMMTNCTDAFMTLDRLNGIKHLVSGNHDAVWPGHREARKVQRRWLEHFESIQPFAKIKLAGEEVLLSHFPYEGDHTEFDRNTQFRLRDEGRWLLHGHLHIKSRVTGPRSIHVGLDAWGLAPARDNEVICEMHSIFSNELAEGVA